MAKHTVDTLALRTAVNAVRPISYEDKASPKSLQNKIWIADGIMYSYYKNVLLSIHYPHLENIQVSAEDLRTVVNAAKSKEIEINITDAGNFIAKAGKVRTQMKTLNDPMDTIEANDNWYTTDGELLPTLLSLSKWVPDQAQQVFATTLLLRNGYAYASDGKYMIREKLNVDFDFECGITKPMLDVLTKLKAEPTSIAYRNGKLYFGLVNGVELNAPVLSQRWPDIDVFFRQPFTYQPFTTELTEVLSQLSSYDETGTALIEVRDKGKAKAYFPTRQLPRTIVDISFDSTEFPINFDTGIKYWSRLSKDMTEFSISPKFIAMQNEKRLVILACIGK